MELTERQRDAVNQLVTKRKCLCIAKMGSGKTVTTLTALDNLIKNKEAKRILVVAPLRVAQTVWAQEIDKWPHLRHLRVVKALGNREKRISALRSRTQITIINKENVQWLVSGYKKWPFDTLVVDESSCLKNPSTKLFKALKKVSSEFENVFLLSGTPSPEGYINLWSQIYLLDRGESLTHSITKFRTTYFYQKPYDMYGWHLRKGAASEIEGRIASRCISMEGVEIPVEYTDMKIKLPERAVKSYKELEKFFLTYIEDKEASAANSAVLVNKLLQICNGVVYDADKNKVQVHDEKISALREIRENYPAENILVAYSYRSDLSAILDNFPEAEILSPDTIDRWNRGEVKMLVASPKSAGHGLNLQYGGSLSVWYGLTWSLEQYQQFNARLARTGQKNRVRIIRIVAEDSVEDGVVSSLLEKGNTQENFLNAMRSFSNGRKGLPSA